MKRRICFYKERSAYNGYHKIELETPVIMKKGQKYSIIETLITPENTYAVNIPIGYGKEPAKSDKTSYWMVGVINKNESFLSMDGKWYDCSGMKKELIKKAADEYYSDFTVDNLPIKGYSTKLNIECCANTETSDETDLTVQLPDSGAEAGQRISSTAPQHRQSKL